MNNPTPQLDGRFMLWIDGVGGFLVCEGSTVAVGQPAQGAQVDVPIMADLSRRHALLHREGEHYVFEPLRRCRLADQPVDRPVRLGDESLLELGDDARRGVRLRFSLPNVCSRTARLDVCSAHRLHPHADGVVLLAESCLIGPDADDHIRAPRWQRTAVLHRRTDGSLVFRTDGPYDVDGVRASGASRIARTTTITGPDFALRLEPLS